MKKTISELPVGTNFVLDHTEFTWQHAVFTKTEKTDCMKIPQILDTGYKVSMINTELTWCTCGARAYYIPSNALVIPEIKTILP